MVQPSIDLYQKSYGSQFTTFNGRGVDWPRNLLLTTNTKNDATTVDIHRIGPAPKARISDLDNVEKHMIFSTVCSRFHYFEKEGNGGS